jgi:peptide/nickel transport system substrate-binding protein
VAASIVKYTVVNPTTLKFELGLQTPKFANSILQTGLNWIAPASSIAAGTAAINEHPIGAGPYTLTKWAQGDVVSLARNDSYYGTKPYLDNLEIRYSFDAEQRFNTLTTGGADLSLEGQAINIDKAEKAGLQQNVLDFGGGTMLTLNNTKAPFDDIRARQGLAAALDLSQIDDAINQGTGTLPTTLFSKTSPFYEDIPLITKDPAEAQKLFDALAADGKPLSFELSLFQGNDALGASIQTQLSAFKNVTVKIKTIDLASYGKTVAAKAFDAMQNSLTFGVEPEPRLWNGLYSTSTGNLSGVKDPELDKALDAGLLGTDEAARKAAYHDVQERLVEVVPVIIYASSVLGVMANNNVGGIQQYGFGSLLPETLWIKK